MLSGNVCFMSFVCERVYVSDVITFTIFDMVYLFIGIIYIPVISYRYVMILLHRLVVC